MVGADGPAQGHEALAQFLEDAGESGVVQPHAAVLFGHGDAEKTQFFHPVDEIVGHGVIAVVLAGYRLHFPPHKVADHTNNLGSSLWRCSRQRNLLLIRENGPELTPQGDWQSIPGSKHGQ